MQPRRHGRVVGRSQTSGKKRTPLRLSGCLRERKEMAGISLRDQLLKAGLVNQKQAKQVGKEKQKEQRLVHKGQAQVDDSQKRAAQEALAEKVKRDQELNRQQQEKVEQKARAAQVKQLIEASRLPKLTTEDYYNFVDDKKVKRISVNTLVRNKLSSGSLAIVHHGGGYEIIPREAALKIQERDPRRIVLLNTPTEAPDADDPYAAYQVPDDLMW
ncbi:Nucleoprotein/polynucleotide-associated enzyme [Pseudomonas syringae pv. ribicola]|uniref:Nucleoprotein/polynucleotide-associated enzyme n=3 Tax=Pseudomonas syringae group TaxID=136849 RepID=A0A0N8SNW3_PSESI|nr:Nucleoprotein/polynucleotide-associated enzyme [Pseudomonas syringae pv. ribicola]